MSKVLLIIDMQKGCFKTPRFNKESICENINFLSSKFRSSGEPVIFIQHDGTLENYLYPNSDDFNIIDELDVEESDLKIIKTANDAFYKTNLLELLATLNAKDLYICGLATDFCVNATIHSALVKDFSITVVSDSHTTSDKPQIRAKSIIDYHNLIWDNLTPTNGFVTVKSSKELFI